MHIKNVKKEQIFKAQTVWPKNFQECLLICKQRFIMWIGIVTVIVLVIIYHWLE